ncbi:hypothetical protein A3D14_03440 [Candidatus Saccharibacteria bacterium RIFCSPHIGHO2_02_FULL_47_12]|nr:MAG: hypothetical protein A3D14_03440 [Candidatus Saccharibacteria bacterium RIFCSPHIGHO2_02_FULL_47_12]
MKTAKTPPVTDKTKLLCFDLESNGLHGQAFAVGAVVMDMQGKVHDQFTARMRIHGQVDEWVEKNVLPAISDMPITHATYKDMCTDFWKWFVAAQKNSDYTLVSNGYPVEYRFLLDCQEGDIDTRYWEHPFPLIDVSSLLLGAGLISNSAKQDLVAKATKDEEFKNHHPLHDAKTAALTAIEALKTSA